MMKKLIFSFIFLFFIIAAHSQSTRISVVAHPQFVWLASDNDKVENEGLMAGFNTGLSLDFFFAEKYAFSTGIFFENLGGRISYMNDVGVSIKGSPYIIPTGVELKQRLRYLGIPLGLKLKTQEIGYATFFINPGFTPMVNLRSKAHGGLIPKKSDFSDETKLLNINYFFSGGVEYSLGGSTSLFGGIGYSAGILDISTKPDYKISTRSLFILTGILF